MAVLAGSRRDAFENTGKIAQEPPIVLSIFRKRFSGFGKMDSLSSHVVERIEAVGEPPNYYHGLADRSRLSTQSAVVFLQRSRAALQRTKISNRSHHRHVLLYVIRTAGTVALDGSHLRIRPGEALLVRPFQLHFYPTVDLSDIRWLFVTFELERGGEKLQELDHRIIRTGAETRDTLCRLLHLWADSSGRGGAGLFLPLLDSLLALLLRDGDSQPGLLPARTREDSGSETWISRIQAELKQTVESNLTIEEVARKAGCSVRHLRDRFQKETGVSLRDYRANFQIHRARSLIRETDLSLAEISVLTGFQSQQAFSRFFQAKTGKRPSEYRRTGKLI